MKRNFSLVIQTLAVCIALLSFSLVSADPINVDQASDAVDGWLAQNKRPFKSGQDYSIASVETYTNHLGTALYYCVNLDPRGFVIVSADDDAEPVIAFAAKGRYECSEDNPLFRFVSADIPARYRYLKTPVDEKRMLVEKARRLRIRRNRRKWNSLRTKAPNRRDLTPLDAGAGDTPPPGDSTIDAVRVAPLLQSTWGQYGPEGYRTPKCYNYYTPSNYPSGCVATAMAQVMRYHEYPTSFPDQENAGMTQYPDYLMMPLRPRIGIITTQQCQEIGMFCYQAGLSVDMEYSSAGSAAITSDAGKRFTDTFGYSNSIEYYSFDSDDSISQARITEMINPNLDARLPVIISIRNSSEYYGHAVVCDGYGFNDDTQYHHLNMGWDGSHNIWYALPIIDADSSHYYDLVYTCIYNVYTEGTGEIISGRILDHEGNPLAEADVSLNGGIYTTKTDQNGIYAFTQVPSNSSYTLSVVKDPWEFDPVGVNTGQSRDGFPYNCGNVWGLDLNGRLDITAILFDSEMYSPGQEVVISLNDGDLQGSGSYRVTVTTTYGDSEDINLIETPAGSGLFLKAVDTAQSAIIQGNGTLEIWDRDVITVEYIDQENPSGNPVTLTGQADVTGLPSIAYFEDFENGMPPGWEVIDGGTGNNTWEIVDPLEGNLDTFIFQVDSSIPETEEFDEQLVSTVFNCSEMSDVVLSFDHDFKYYEDEICDVDISVNNGPWQNIERWQNEHTHGRVELDISELADGKENVRIRWHYYNAVWEWYWAIDNVTIEAVTPPMPPVAYDSSVSAETAFPVTIELSAADDLTFVDDLEFVITALPTFGSLSDPQTGEITPAMIPYTLPGNGNEVIYTANPCFEGWDVISFKASDGGVPPHGGLSKSADVSIRVWPPTVYYTDFSTNPLDDGWSVFDGFSDGYTWQHEQVDGLSFMVADSQAAGPSIIMDERLISPVFDCSDYNVVYLLFDHYFSFAYDFGAEVGDVEVSVDGGDWQTVATYRDVDYNGFEELDVSDIAAGHSQVQFRWRYHNAQWDDFWAVYEMWLLGLNASPLADIDADCDVDLVDFAQLSAAWQTVYGDDDYCYACDIAEPFDIVEINDLAEVIMFWMSDF